MVTVNLRRHRNLSDPDSSRTRSHLAIRYRSSRFRLCTSPQAQLKKDRASIKLEAISFEVAFLWGSALGRQLPLNYRV